MNIIRKLESFFSSENPEDYPEIGEIVLTTRNYRKNNIDQLFLENTREHIRDEELLSQEDGSNYQLIYNKGKENEAYLTFKIAYMKPEKGRPTEETNVHIMDYHYFDESKEEFNIPSTRKIAVKELPENELDMEVEDPWSMVNIFDKNPKTDIYVQKKDSKYLCNGYYFEFEE